MSARRVALVAGGAPPQVQWGAGYYAAELARALSGRGHAVAVLCPEVDGSRPRGTLEPREHARVEVTLVHKAPDPRKRLDDSWQCPEVERAFTEWLHSTRPDVVHFVHLVWSLSVRLPALCRSAGIPCVLTLADFGLLCHRGQFFDWRLADCGGPHEARVCARCIREPSMHDAGAIERTARRGVAHALALIGGLGCVATRRDVERRERAVAEALDAVTRFVAPTRAMADVFVRAGVAAERVDVVPYGIDLAAQPPARDPRRTRIAYLGQFAPHKGVHVLLEAARTMQHRLPESVEPWDLRLFGEPPDLGVRGRHRRYAEALAARLDPPQIAVAPRFEPRELPAVLAELDCVVVPSLWRENAPFAVLQARAAGVLVVASDVPGIREVVEPGVDGVLVAPGDARALADALRDVILRRVVRSPRAVGPPALGEHARAIEAIYSRVLEPGRIST